MYKQLALMYQAQEDDLRKEQRVLLEISRICRACNRLAEPEEELQTSLLKMKRLSSVGPFGESFCIKLLDRLISQLQKSK